MAEDLYAVLTARAWSYPCPDVLSLARRHNVEVPDHG